MQFSSQLRTYGRFATGFGRFLRRRMTVDEARAFIREQIDRREENFLRLMRKGVYGYEASPYRPLLEMADCAFGDLETMVRRDGIESALDKLRDAGVYVSFEEFKGRKPVVRDGREIPLAPRQFDNPYTSTGYTTSTGGSTGAGTRVSTDLTHLAHQAAHALVTQDAHGVAHVPRALWRPILPAGSGVNNLLRSAYVDRIPRRWFTPVTASDLRPPLRFRLANAGVVLLGRMYGFPLPWPEPVHLHEGVKVARWVADTVRTGGGCLVLCTVSSAVRVCVAAREAELDVGGATFMIAGEPATPAKVRRIREAGARHFTTYGLTETGRIAMGCASPHGPNDLHVLSDLAALIQRPRALGPGRPTVHSFYMTSLLPSAPKIMLNVEIDDCGVLEKRSCGCLLEELGYDWHVRDIRSYTKLTGDGVTLVVSEMLDVLETVLPERFGGCPLDYQIQEEEGEGGLTRLVLRISPRVRIDDETAVVRALADGLRRSSQAGGYAQAIWTQGDSFRVLREEPVWTERGKLPQMRGVSRFRASDSVRPQST